jgi:signal transduction histidine kinase
MTELSKYKLESLREDPEFVFYRGRRDAAPCSILVVAPSSKQPARQTLRRTEHEYKLRTELDPAWETQPLDITERKQAEEELKRIRRLEGEMLQASRTEMLGGLTASLAHELNQPLSSIQSSAEAARLFLAAQNRTSSKSKQQSMTSSRTTSGRLKPSEMFVRSLSEIKWRCRLSISEKFCVMSNASSGLPLSSRTLISGLICHPHSQPSLATGPSLFETLMNLLNNAFDSICESAAGAREVQLSASEQDAGRVHIAIRDSGKGINPEIVPRLFNAFFTTKPRGMGMGLAIVRSIVENHGGRLWATPNPDCGATLEFDLPVKASAL